MRKKTAPTKEDKFITSRCIIIIPSEANADGGKIRNGMSLWGTQCGELLVGDRDDTDCKRLNGISTSEKAL